MKNFSYKLFTLFPPHQAENTSKLTLNRDQFYYRAFFLDLQDSDEVSEEKACLQ